MEHKVFLGTLLTLAHECGISLSEEQARLCGEHISLMLQWNRRCNLTRITDFREIIEKHLLDSLIPARWLPHTGLAVDIGSGPGFPGIPLKILHPQLDMLLIESHRKKASFLKVALSKLPLKNISALQARWETLTGSEHPFLSKPIKLATMRAVKLEPKHLAVAASKMLDRDGIFAWWAGPSADPGCDPHGGVFDSTGMTFQKRYSYTLPSGSQPRYLFVWQK
jgi:16S rRNA (guanine527-N7)-methyltransferase